MSQQQQFVGDVLQCEGDDLVIDVKNRFELGDKLELMTPTQNVSFVLTELQNRDDECV